LLRKHHVGLCVLPIGIVAVIVVIIAVVRIIIRIGISVPQGISKKEISVVPEMISVRKVRSLVSCEAMASKTMPGKPGEMATGTSEMTTTATEASTMATTKAASSSTMATAAATASSTMCERGGGC